MTVIVVTACPVGLRGHLTRWLMEISPGVFIGKITARVRALVWARVTEMAKTGRAIMVFAADNEQGLDFAVHGHDWTPVDYEGLHLILRPSTDSARTHQKTGWSNAAKRRRHGST